MSKLYAIRQTGKSNYWYDFVEDFTSVELDEHCVSNDLVYVKECQNNLSDLNPAWKNSEIVEFGIIADLEAKLAEKEKENELMAKTLKMTKFVEKEVIQDKISFCIEQLEKVRELINKNYFYNLSSDSCTFDKLEVDFQIDNQIEQLKEMKQYE